MKPLTRLLTVSLSACLALTAPAQQPSAVVMNDAQAVELYERCLLVMESAGVALPDVARAGTPLAENARLAYEQLRQAGIQNPAPHYRFLVNLRAFLLLSDAVPKPYPFPEEAKRQLLELRESQARIETYFQVRIEQLQNQLREPDRDNLRRYAELNARTAPPVAGQPRVVFMGDSITDGWRLNEYFPNRDFINRGISGQTTGQMLGRFRADVVLLKPAVVVILGGTNDIARGINAAAVENNLAMMVDIALANNIRPVLATLLPVSDYHKDVNPGFERTKLRPPDTIRAINEWMRVHAEQRKFGLLNYYSGLVDPAGFLQANLGADGLHPDAAGYRVMAPLAHAAIEKELQAIVQVQPKGRRLRLF